MSEPQPDGAAQRPSFARNFPRTPELDALVAAFVAGDYARVREDAPKLISSSDNVEVKNAATLLRERIEPDPLANMMLLATLLLLAFMTGWWILHDGPAH
jgi:hypothetical protein